MVNAARAKSDSRRSWHSADAQDNTMERDTLVKPLSWSSAPAACMHARAAEPSRCRRRRAGLERSDPSHQLALMLFARASFAKRPDSKRCTSSTISRCSPPSLH